VRELLASADAALSLLPAPMHAPVAEECIRTGTPLVTASYVSPELQALHEQAEAAGVPILAEMGLDPGMDHMSAVELIDRAHAEGGKVTSFSSVCGGLPAPECASTTPIAYKFSWSPAGVLGACHNPARYLQGGSEVSVAADQLLHSATALDAGRLGRAFRLEVLPNRDSLPYADLYGIAGEASSVFRGTLRYAGWSELFAQFISMGLTANVPLPAGMQTWPALLAHLRIPTERGECASELQARAVDALHSLGAVSVSAAGGGGAGRAIGRHALVSEAFCALLSEQLSYGPGERDAVFMEHTLRVEYPETSKPAQLISSSLVGYGEPDGATCMSRTVGLTAALGVLRILEEPTQEMPKLSGVLRPTHARVYKYCLSRLAEEGLVFEESVTAAP